MELVEAIADQVERSCLDEVGALFFVELKKSVLMDQEGFQFAPSLCESGLFSVSVEPLGTDFYSLVRLRSDKAKQRR